MKIRNIVAFFLVYFSFIASAHATKLPQVVVSTLQKELPKASIRFDGLVTLPNGVVYLPVLPSDPKKDATGKVVQTFPAGKKLSQFPDMVIFDNNFALLKVIKTKDGRITVLDSKNIPLVVKTGLFPQDMLVPPGLILPEDMKIMLGDLKIATSSSSVNDILKEPMVKKETYVSKIVPVPNMKNRTLLITTLDSSVINIVPADSAVPSFTLKPEGFPRFVQPVCDDKYILVATGGKTYIDVADIKQEVIAKKIDLSYHPTEILLNSDKSKAYVAVADDQAIYTIDLETMTLLEKIKVKGTPKNLAISADDKTIAYTDTNNGDIYVLVLGDTFLNKFISASSNISKLVVRDGYIYGISRSDSKLHVYDIEDSQELYEHEVSTKPVDMFLRDDYLYILSAKGYLHIFNLTDYSDVAKIILPNKGFYRRIVEVPNTNIVLITNITEKLYYVFDLTKNQIIQSVSTPLYINELKLMNKPLK